MLFCANKIIGLSYREPMWAAISGVFGFTKINIFISANGVEVKSFILLYLRFPKFCYGNSQMVKYLIEGASRTN